MRKRPARMRPTKKKNYKWMIYLIAFVMIFSSFFISTRIYDQQETEPEPELELERYEVVPVGNLTALFTIEQELNEFIAIPLRSELLNAEMIRAITETPLDGVDRVTAELSSSFLLFKFYTTNATIDDIKLLLDSEIVDYNLLKGYKGVLAGNEVYIMGSMNLEVGDYIKAILMQKMVNNVPSGLMGFQQKRLVVGPDIPASVLDAGRAIVFARFKADINIIELNETMPMDIIEYYPATIVSDLNDSLIEQLNSTGANITAGDGGVRVFPVDEIAGLLDIRNINYTIEAGQLSFYTNDTKFATSVLEERGISNITLWREGQTSTVDEFVLDGRSVVLPGSENLTSLLFLNTTSDQNITIHIQTIVIGEQVIPISAYQI